MKINGNLQLTGVSKQRASPGCNRDLDKGSAPESMRVTIAMTHNIADMEHEEATSGSGQIYI